MSANNNKKKSRRRHRYHAVTFKLTSGQYKSLKNYCKARRTTPIKLIKKSIDRFISSYEYEVPAELYVTENQLNLFEEMENEQMTVNEVPPMSASEKLKIEIEQLSMNFD